jgi:hypothetical protein
MTTYDPTNAKHINIQRRSAQAAQDSADAFLHNSMGMADGRSYFHSILVRCHVFANPYAGDAGSTAFACGELNVGQQVLADIMRVCPDEYIKMMREANARDAADDSRRTRSDEDTRRADSGSEPDAYVHPALDTGRIYSDIAEGDYEE